MERGDWQQAEEYLGQAVRTCGSDADARRQFAETLWHRGLEQEAIDQLEICAQSPDADAALHVSIAEKHLAMGQSAAALQSAQRAVDRDPKSPAAWAIRARVRHAQGRLREALADYHRALGLAPSDRDITLEIAELYRLLNEPQRALAALDALSESYSPGEEPQQVLYLQGLAYKALARYDEAAESFSLAAERGRPTPEILAGLAEAHLLAGRPVEAAAAAQEALALDPRNRPSRQVLDEAQQLAARAGATSVQ